MSFITPQNLRPLGPGPVLVLIGPVQPPVLLSLREERLLGSATARNLQFLGDDMTDGPLGDVTELTDLLLETKRSQEWIPLQLLLDLLLQIVRNLSVGATRARIRLLSGRSGQATVSCSTSPLASIFAVLLPLGEGPDGNLHLLGDGSWSRARLHFVEGDHFGRITSLRL